MKCAPAAEWNKPWADPSSTLHEVKERLAERLSGFSVLRSGWVDRLNDRFE